ncbi:endoglucanase [Mariniphaga anaerophila]|uniref:Endoglucanase n=1 Tax=Mariniphaga anaerophila TaxID=1484053 RepID=A0A1M4SLF4_9BACT|nr:glycoside hydrolase family 5 protein [Mariniphaga anaerophila]SHE32978.1 endoglucanase [Mariniphaga anaerophila]
MKKILLALLLITLTSAATSLKAQPVKENGHLAVDGKHLVNTRGEPLMLAGVSYGWHNWWPRFYNEQTVEWLAKDWGCNVVRAAMGIGPHRSYLDQPEWSKEKIEAVIKGAIKNDIYVIIDWHAHGIFQEAAETFFAEMAQKYGKYPHIIYEIFNEPVHDSWEKVKDYSIAVIRAIREHDPDNVILVGNPHWDQDIHLVADSPIEGFENLMYTVHFYADTHKQDLRDRCQYAIAKNIPVFISESAGMSANGDGPINYEEWHKWIDFMKENKISWVSWSIADKDESCSMLKPSASDFGKWKADDMKESGIKTRELLRKFAGLD